MDEKLIQIFFENIVGSALNKGKEKSKKFWEAFFTGENHFL